MRMSPNNTPDNTLPAGIEESSLIDAVERSGYPLQSVVADQLQSRFKVAEEWGYVDRSGDHRSLDVLAYRTLSEGTDELAEGTDETVQPSVALLIECKRSRLPYVFFQSIDRRSPGVPAVSGTPHGKITIRQKTSSTTHWSKSLGPVDGLRLDLEPFISSPPVCSVFSAAQRKGDGFQLSGDVPFNKIVMPLINALEDQMERGKPLDHRPRLFPRLIVLVAVVDLPMVLVEGPGRSADPVLAPWVRVIRQEAPGFDDRFARWRYYGVDVVHISFLSAYVEDHLLPFADEFAARVTRYSHVLEHGLTVRDLDDWSLMEAESP